MQSTNLSVYMFNTLYSFFQDNGQTPHIWVRTENLDNPVIRDRGHEGVVVLNIGPNSCALTVRDWGLDFSGAFDRKKQGTMIKWEDIVLFGGRPRECKMPPLWFGAAEFPDFKDYSDEAPAETPPVAPTRPKFGLIQGGKE
jgi:stringent starvation protein B